MPDCSWSEYYERFSRVLEDVEQCVTTDSIDPQRHRGDLRVELQYEDGDAAWPSELRRIADEVEMLNEELGPDGVNVRTYPDMVEVFLTFEVVDTDEEDGGESA